MWPIKNQNIQKFALNKFVTWNCDTLQKCWAPKTEKLVPFVFINFISVESRIGHFGHAQYLSRDKVFFFFFFLEKYYNGETLNSVSTLVEEICQQPMHYMLTNSLDNFVTDC